MAWRNLRLDWLIFSVKLETGQFPEIIAQKFSIFFKSCFLPSSRFRLLWRLEIPAMLCIHFRRVSVDIYLAYILKGRRWSLLFQSFNYSMSLCRPIFSHPSVQVISNKLTRVLFETEKSQLLSFPLQTRWTLAKCVQILWITVPLCNESPPVWVFSLAYIMVFNEAVFFSGFFQHS